jgi:uncharacterized membrane protein YgcG
MTDVKNAQPRPSGAQAKAPDRRATLGSKPAFWPTVIIVSASFLLLFEFLAFQLAHGRDPAVGGASSSAAAAKPPRPVLVRRVVETRVIADGGSDSGTSSAVSAGSASSGGSAASAAQAAAPAPAPAPAAPVVSSSS